MNKLRTGYDFGLDFGMILSLTVFGTDYAVQPIYGDFFQLTRTYGPGPAIVIVQGSVVVQMTF